MTTRTSQTGYLHTGASPSGTGGRSRLMKYLAGLFVPGALLTVAVRYWYTQEAFFLERSPRSTPQGSTALAAGMVWAAAALLLFAHYFLKTGRFKHLTSPVKAVALAALVPALGYIFFSFIAP